MADKIKLLDLFNSIATKAGIPDNDSALMSVLADSSLQDFEIPKEVSDRINSSLLSIDMAKKHPDIKSHYGNHISDTKMDEIKNSVRDELDSVHKGNVKRLLNNYSIPNERIDAILSGTKSNTKRYEEALELVASAKIGDSEIQKRYSDLQGKHEQMQAQVESVKSDYEARLKQKDDTYRTAQIDMHLTSKLASVPYGESYGDDAAMFAKLKLDNAIKHKGGAVILDNGLPKLVDAKDNSLPLVNGDHSHVTLDSLINEVVEPMRKKNDKPKGKTDFSLVDPTNNNENKDPNADIRNGYLEAAEALVKKD